MSENIKEDILVTNISDIQCQINNKKHTYVLQTVFLIISKIQAKKKSERTFETRCSLCSFCFNISRQFFVALSSVHMQFV